VKTSNAKYKQIRVPFLYFDMRWITEFFIPALKPLLTCPEEDEVIIADFAM
jgi:hypothetical protein